MIADLNGIKERWRMYDEEVRAGGKSMDVQTHAIEPLLEFDVPAMIAELEQWRAGTQGARVLELVPLMIEHTRRLIDDASLLAAYIEGVTKTGGGSKLSARNMIASLEVSMKVCRILVSNLEILKNDTINDQQQREG